MRWVTRSHLHLDRAATPWLIRRFVDPDASFEFVGWGQDVELPDGAIPFGVPGVELGAHDEHGTTFGKVRRRYGLDDPALVELEALVAAGVRWALRIEAPAEQSSTQTALGRALDGLGRGMAVFTDDAAIVEVTLPVFDAFYVYCQMTTAPREVRAEVPQDPDARRAYWRARLRDPARSVSGPKN